MLSRVAGPISEMGAHPVHMTLIRRLRVGHKELCGNGCVSAVRKEQRDCWCPVLVSFLSTTVPVCDEAEIVLGELFLPSTSS